MHSSINILAFALVQCCIFCLADYSVFGALGIQGKAAFEKAQEVSEKCTTQALAPVENN